MPTQDRELTPYEIAAGLSGPRASGRTCRMIMALPERAVVVVGDNDTMSHIRREMDRHRGVEFSRRIPIVRVLNDGVGLAALRLMRSPVFVDHSFWENPNLLYRIGRQVEAMAERTEPPSQAEAGTAFNGTTDCINTGNATYNWSEHVEVSAPFISVPRDDIAPQRQRATPSIALGGRSTGRTAAMMAGTPTSRPNRRLRNRPMRDCTGIEDEDL